MRTRTFLLTLLAFGATAAPASGAVGFAPAPGSPFGANFRPYDIATGDVNGDGRDDVVTANASNPGKITTLLASPSGALTASPAITSGAGATLGHVAVGDLNGDGKLDVVAATDNAPGQIVALLGDGTGAFTLAPGHPRSINSGPETRYPSNMRLVDVTGDGKLDAVTSNYIPGATNGSVSVFVGDGAGGMALMAGAPFPATEPIMYDVDAADINSDGRRDLVWIHYESGNAFYRLQTAMGGFGNVSAPIDANAGGAPDAILARDVDGDGKVDLVFPNSSGVTGDVTVLKGNGAAGFAPMPGSPYDPSAPFGYAVGAADLDADGKVEIVTSHDDGPDPLESRLSVLAPAAGGGFAKAAGSPFAWNTVRATSLATGDFNADGQPDAVTADGQDTGKVGVLLNTNKGKPTFSPSSLTFPATDVGRQTGAQALGVTNTGNGFLRVASAGLTGSGATDYKLADSCSGRTLLRGAGCGLALSFAPKAAGVRSATLTVRGADGSAGTFGLNSRGLDRVKPVIRSLKISKKRFAVGRKRTVSFNLSEPATVKLVVQKAATGRRKGKKCVKPTARLRRARKCTRYLKVKGGTLTRSGKAGANKVSFTGKLGKRKLKPGKYRFEVTATDPSKNRSKPARVGFTILKPKK